MSRLVGGSGLSDDDFRTAVQNGISKINIFADLCRAGVTAMEKGLLEGQDYLTLRNQKVDAIRETVKSKMLLFGSQGKA